MFNKLGGLFPFRSGANFTLCFLTLSGTGYFAVKWSRDKKYDHPIVQESLRLLQQNEQIIKLTGYPLSLKIVLASQATISDQACHYTFKVTGPKGSANVELMGQSRELKEIKEPDQFYIPSLNQILDLMNNESRRLELKELELPQDSKFWKIDHLTADIGLQGDFRINIVDSNKIIQPTEQKPIPKVITKRQTFADLRQELDSRKPKIPETEQEIEEARRYRQQELYRKVGGVRILSIFVALLGGMAIYNYIRQNRRLSVLNSQIHLQALGIIKRNSFVEKEFGRAVHFNTQLRGGQIGNDAEFETDIYGKKIGIVYVTGYQDPKRNNWTIKRIDVAIKDSDGILKEKQNIWNEQE